MEPAASVAAPWLSALVFLCTFLSSHTLNTKIHNQMTADELRYVFHVDHHSLVPEYHPVHLTHRLSRRNIPTSHHTNSHNRTSSKIPHEKYQKPYKNWKTETSPPSLLNDEMFVKAKETIKDVDIIGDLNNTVSVNFDVSKSSESDSASSEVKSDIIQDLKDEVTDGELDEVHRIELEAFGKQLKLNLKKQDSLFKKEGLKMWRAMKNESQPHGVDYEELETEGDDDLGEVYQDEETGAALLIRRHPKHGKLMVEGSIGHDLVIRPVPDSMTSSAPDSIASPTQDDEMFLDPGSMSDMVSIDTGLPIGRRKRDEQDSLLQALNGAHHVIIKRGPANMDHESDYAFMEPDRLGSRFRSKRSADPHSRRKRDAPYVIYPEILVIVDYDGYRLHGGDNVQIKRYFVSFWNGVDLRYKLLKGPRIRVSIAGIIISRGRDATPYLERNRVGRDAIDSAAALTDMGKYLFRERRLPVYDIAVAITKLDMCRRQYANDACNRGTAGFAYVGGACVVNKRLEKVNSVAIIEDTGGFSGIIVAAHEVGHLLGAVHDGSPPPSYLGGPGAEKCRWEDGFIMSDLRHTEKGFRWSPCSVQSFHHFLNGDTATCLYNSPHEDDSLPRVLPGRLLTLDAQCRKDRGTSACFKDERVCAQLFCFDAASGYCVAYRPAAEGSPCGDGQYCINGRCITEHENIIPDYSQHTPSYVRPDSSPFFGNITSFEGTTQPYVAITTPVQYNYYSGYKQSEHSTTTTENYYNYYNNYYSSSSTTSKPYDYNSYYNEKTTSSTSKPYDFNSYYSEKSTSSTSKPYDYNSYYSEKSTSSTSKPYDYNSYYNEKSTSSTSKPYDYNSYYNEKTTSSTSKPYDYNSYYNEKSTSSTSKPYDYNSYYNEKSTSSTSKPYDYNSYYNEKSTSSTSKPYDYNSYYNEKTSSTTQRSTYPPSINKYSISTTRSPYDFKDFATRTTKAQTKVDTRHGFYSKSDFDSYFGGRSTTKIPFGVKSHFKIGTLYSQGKSSDNSIRPDASQQVNVEPARLVYSYQRNLTTGEIRQN